MKTTLITRLFVCSVSFLAAQSVTVKGNPTLVRQRASGGSDIRTR